MTTKVFKNHVHVNDAEGGERHVFEPGDKCPAHLVDLIDPNNFEGGRVKGEVAPGDDEAAVNYNKLKKPELEELAADRGLDFEGTRDELIARLEASDAAHA